MRKIQHKNIATKNERISHHVIEYVDNQSFRIITVANAFQFHLIAHVTTICNNEEDESFS